MKRIIPIILLLLCTVSIQAKDVFIYGNQSGNLSIGYDALVTKDSTNQLTIQDVMHSGVFAPYKKKVINFGVSPATFWVSFAVLNNSDEPNLLIDLPQPCPNHVELYMVNADGSITVQKLGTSYSFAQRSYNHQDYIFDAYIPVNSTRRFYLKIESSTQITLPVSIGKSQDIFQQLINKDLVFGIFFGIVFCMFFYNLFIYSSVKDNIYIYYVLYILITAISQCTLQGYTFKYLWPHSQWLAANGSTLFTNLGSVAAAIFTKKFLRTKLYLPKLDAVFTVLIGIMVFSTLLVFFNQSRQSFFIMQNYTLAGAAYVILLALLTIRKGYRPARYFLLAWLSVCGGAVIAVLKDYGTVDITPFTSNSLEVGFAIEVIVLAFALADRINEYKFEKEASQAEALHVSLENEKLIQEQNIMLERQVAERTYDLEKTLSELKDAQIQLVESEKMASLGQLTAGIAHEINNPINFVKSNVSPLQMDVHELFELITEYQKLHGIGAEEQHDMLKHIKTLEYKLDPDFLKEEIQSLISGIEEGAERTAEIVRGLRNFSRLDESEMKEINIYENINSTLILLRNITPSYLKIRKHFEARAEIECYPGKLNQVFMNILTNCIQAIKVKPVMSEEEYIDISVQEASDCMRITIADTGIGMTEEVKRKVFDPFFTTKDVGEGTGLGMAIVFKIIEKHHGKIGVQSSPGKGAAFIIEIPYMLKSVSEMAEEGAHS